MYTYTYVFSCIDITYKIINEMATNALKASLPRLPEKPNHLKDFVFFQQMLRKSKPVMHSVQTVQFNSRLFLSYGGSHDTMFCHTCHGILVRLIKSHISVANAFVSTINDYKYHSDFSVLARQTTSHAKQTIGYHWRLQSATDSLCWLGNVLFE